MYNSDINLLSNGNGLSYISEYKVIETYGFEKFQDIDIGIREVRGFEVIILGGKNTLSHVKRFRFGGMCSLKLKFAFPYNNLIHI
jgi:hypothetical protein